MKGPSWFIVASLLLAALAGCSDSKDKTQEEVFEDLDLQATEDTGIIRGLVLDSAIAPVVGVTVTIEGTEQTAETNENGAFGFDGVAPGSYFLVATKPGYVTAQQSVEVVANVADPPLVRMLLERDPSTTPFVDVFKFDGFIECSFALVVVLFAACGVIPDDLSNNEFLVDHTFGPGVLFVQCEMIWDSTQALGDELSLSYTDLSGAEQRQMNATSGPSPLVLVLDEPAISAFALENGTVATLRVFANDLAETDVIPIELIQDTYNSTAPDPVRAILGENCIEYPVLFDACLNAGGVGVTFQQEYTVFTHAFYYHLPPAAWQFTEDGDPPAPEA